MSLATLASPDLDVAGPDAAVRPGVPSLDAPLLSVTGEGVLVPLVDRSCVPYANLDIAASAPALSVVAAEVAAVLPYYSSVHRGAGYLSQVSTSLYENSRTTIASFLGARVDDVVVFTRNTTDALNLLARAVPAGGEVLYLDIEHHANLLPWQSLPHRCVPAAHTLAGTVQALADALAEHPAALVAVTGASNVTGELLPIARLAEIAHANGARIVVDAAQLAPHRRIDLAALDIDYLAFSGHKLYAPFGSGVLVGRRDWLDAAEPYLAGGGAVRLVEVDQAEWAPAPQRHEAGTPNVLGAVAIARACRELAALPIGALEEHERVLCERLTQGLKALPGVRLLQIWPDATERIGVVSFTVAGHEPGRVAAYLSAEHGIGVRDGAFCAHPLLRRLVGAAPGSTPAALRASVGVGTTLDDVERLLTALELLLTDGESVPYAKVDGRWAPADDARGVPSAAGSAGCAAG
jgi:selenocysteine lyase/cysteine desulfurase